MQKPLVSIIIPVYNTSSFLKKCLDSCLHQTYRNIEIIALNDGSLDNSLNILQDYQRTDNRIIVIDKFNEGLLLTRKRGIDESKGEFVFFLDSDDSITIDAIENLYNVFQNNDNLDVVIGRLIIKTEKKEFVYDNFKPIGLTDIGLKASFILGTIGVNLCGALYKRLVFKDIVFDKNIIIGEDFSINLQIRDKGYRILYTESPVYYYYQNSNSIMHRQSDKILKSHIYFCTWLIDYVNQSCYSDEKVIKDAVAVSSLRGLFFFIYNGGKSNQFSSILDLVNNIYLNNEYARSYLPVYIYYPLFINKYNTRLGEFLIKNIRKIRLLLNKIMS